MVRFEMISFRFGNNFLARVSLSWVALGKAEWLTPKRTFWPGVIVALGRLGLEALCVRMREENF